MKTSTFSTLFAFLAASMMVSGAVVERGYAYNDKYEEYLSRETSPVAVTVESNGEPCDVWGNYCVKVFTNTWSDYQKYQLSPLDGTTGITNHVFTVNKGTFDITQFSGDMHSDKPFRVLMTCGEGNGKEVDYTKGFATIAFNKGYASFNAWNGAKGRYNTNDVFVDAAQSWTANSVQFVCPTVAHGRK